MARLTTEQIEQINALAAEGYINIQHHPTLPLVLYNYSKFATFYCKRNPIIELCRGLICDEDYNIVARPFTKFYNYEEFVTDEEKALIPDLPFKIYDKIDGSLGILYFYDGIPYIATRGSFTSDQAMHATKVLHDRYGDHLNAFNPANTYLFEIVYPQDVHVINYGDMDDIILLAIINTETGEEYDPESLGGLFATPNCYDNIANYLEIRDKIPGTNKEGFVIKFDNNFRIKLKYADYFELHSILYGLSEKSILENIVNGTLSEIEEKLARFEEEQKIYFNSVVSKFNDIFDDILLKVKALYRDDFETRKDLAEYFNSTPYSGILFAMYNKKEYSSAIWKYIWKHRTEFIMSETRDNDEE